MTEAMVDANILLRHLTGQPPNLAERARGILEAAEAQKARLVITAITVAEIVFVLERVYRWPRPRLAAGLRTLLEVDAFHFPEQATLSTVIALYETMPRVHFADAYVAAVALGRAAPLVSLDRELRAIPNLRLVSAPDDLAQ